MADCVILRRVTGGRHPGDRSHDGMSGPCHAETRVADAEKRDKIGATKNPAFTYDVRRIAQRRF
ncbi:MAG: hypothetical protein OXL41_05265 [Nitrospinae bacterium]|nr:hypothetical protein [Nitrospinota bacterium]